MTKKISIQGFKGSWHHSVAVELFGKSIDLIERPTFENVFQDVDFQDADYGIVAIENTIYGSISNNLDLIFRFGHSIVGESFLRVKHNLIAFPGQKIEDIKEIHSHPVALAQCQKFLRESGAEIHESDDTAGFIKEIQENELKGVAGIASLQAAKIYEMEVYKTGIEDDKNNFTRFLIISKQPEKIVDANKTSVVIELHDKSGALASIVNIFAQNNVNMVKIESRPIVGRPWNYRFFIDYEMDIHSDKGKDILSKIQQNSSELRVLGSYKNKIPFQVI